MDFVKADSANLPKVDLYTIVEFLKTSDKHNIAEIRGAKAIMSKRDSYLESAVGYVELKRDLQTCFVKAKIVPEHKIAKKAYIVMVKINETKEEIEDTSCDGCPAAAGGCKHTLLLMYWLEKRSSEPPTTSVKCYWKKPSLSNIQGSAIESKNVYPSSKKIKLDSKNKEILTKISEAFGNIPSCQEAIICKYLFPKRNLSYYCIYNLMLECYNQYHGISSIDFDCFIKYCKGNISETNMKTIEESTRDQVDSVLWHTIRQTRVTASKIYAVSTCKTADGSLVQELLGGYKIPETLAMKRGKSLECKIIEKLKNCLGMEIKKGGFFMADVIFGASPDGITKNYIIEIKCPTSERTFKNYILNNCISKQCMAQIQLQMYCTKIKKCLFCVADHKYEESGKLTLLWVDYDEEYLTSLKEKAACFWKKNIFPKILNSVMSQ